MTNATFIKSSTHYKDSPETNLPEYAFIGRSNVGKSSLINILTGRKKLAMVSGTPGKTKLINHFLIDNSWYLVDLPGYGFAKVSKTEREKWDLMIREYILHRENLVNVFVLVDGSIPPQTIDLDFIRWLGISGIPFAIVLTKTDKVSKNKVQSQLAVYKKELGKEWDELPQLFLSSAVNNSGRDEIMKYIEVMNKNIRES